MRNTLIASFVVVLFGLISGIFSAQAGEKGTVCGKNSPAPAIEVGLGLTWTCDSQAQAGGYNLKPLGSTEPVRYKGCVLRKNGTGGVFTCKIAVHGVRREGDSLILSTAKGTLKVTHTTGLFGGYKVTKAK